MNYGFSLSRHRSAFRTTIAALVIGWLSQSSVVAQDPSAKDSAADGASQFQLTQMLEAIAPYHPSAGVSGKATLTGSTTMLQLGQAWSTRFKQFHKSVEFVRGSDGADSALQALKNDPGVIAGVCRMITAEEVAELKKGKCQDPFVIVVALEPIAVVVSDKNPLQKITPEQLQRVYGSERPVTWAELGAQGAVADSPIRILSRDDRDGTSVFIQQTILHGEKPAPASAVHRSMAEVLQALAKDPSAIALGNLHPAPGVKALALDLNGMAVAPTEASFLAGQYPLVRPLTLVFDKALLETDGGLRREVLNYVLSRDGQSVVLREGFFPINPNFIAQQMASIAGPHLR